VSIKTVSNVVTDAAAVSPSTWARVEAVIAESRCRPSLIASALRTKRSPEA
jgi:DNA-binding LacI/PurR family transcriptional regulator